MFWGVGTGPADPATAGTKVSCTQDWGNQHLNSQAAYVTVVLFFNCSDSVCAQNLNIKSEN